MMVNLICDLHAVRQYVGSGHGRVLVGVSMVMFTLVVLYGELLLNHVQLERYLSSLCLGMCYDLLW